MRKWQVRGRQGERVGRIKQRKITVVFPKKKKSSGRGRRKQRAQQAWGRGNRLARGRDC